MAADIALNEDSLQLVFVTAIGLPLGPGQILPVQDGVYRVPMRKESAVDFANRILEEAENLPDAPQPTQKTSDILVANNMNDVANVAKQTQQFRGGPSGA